MNIQFVTFLLPESMGAPKGEAAGLQPPNPPNPSKPKFKKQIS
jgi:hypothetical protein